MIEMPPGRLLQKDIALGRRGAAGAPWSGGGFARAKSVRIVRRTAPSSSTADLRTDLPIAFSAINFSAAMAKLWQGSGGGLHPLVEAYTVP
eukprot:s1479_g9.t1